MAQIIKTNYQYAYISNGTVAEVVSQIATGPGSLHAIVVTETAGTSIAVIDGTSGTTANLASLKASIAEGSYVFNADFNSGLRIVTNGLSKFTVVYTKNS